MVAVEKFWRYTVSKNFNWAILDTSISVERAEAAVQHLQETRQKADVNYMAVLRNYFFLLEIWRRSFLDDVNHVSHKLLTNLDCLLREYRRSRNGSPTEAEQIERDIRKAEHAVLKKFGEGIDIVFATSNSSGNETMVFDAEVLLMDKAELLNRARAAVPLASCCRTL
jgi:hypothetical protein